MYCTTSLTNDLLISSFSLWGVFSTVKPNKSGLMLKYYISLYWHLVAKYKHFTLKVRNLLLCNVLVFGFCFTDLLLSLLVHSLLKIFFFS